MSDPDEYEFDNVPAETPLSPQEAIIRRHRREKRELQAKCQALKKGSTKDKKKKKEVADEIAKMEAELEARHKCELETFLPRRVIQEDDVKLEGISEVGVEPIVNDEGDHRSSSKGSKAQKRREKKEKEERERARRIEEETKILVQNSNCKAEDERLAAILDGLKLSIVEIPSDGHCLYSAVGHQLSRFSEKFSVPELRAKTAQHLRDHRQEYIPYFDEAIGSNEGAFEQYCKEIAETSSWGGQIEVRVLSQVLGRRITVIQAEGPPLTFGEEFNSDKHLTLTYHRHKFKLGAHYNSALPSK